MKSISGLVLAVFLLSILHTGKSEDKMNPKYLACNVTNATAEATGCPSKSNCIENGTFNSTVDGIKKNYKADVSVDSSVKFTVQGYCVCESGYTANEKYSATDNKTQYCTMREKETQPVEPTKPDKHESPTKNTNTKPEADKNDVKMAPAPGTHHIVGGILIPILIILVFIGAVFAVKKYNLIERAHGYVRGRNQATRYNGLMENDFDDDPLLI